MNIIERYRAALGYLYKCEHFSETELREVNRIAGNIFSEEDIQKYLLNATMLFDGMDGIKGILIDNLKKGIQTFEQLQQSGVDLNSIDIANAQRWNSNTSTVNEISPKMTKSSTSRKCDIRNLLCGILMLLFGTLYGFGGIFIVPDFASAPPSIFYLLGGALILASVVCGIFIIVLSIKDTVYEWNDFVYVLEFAASFILFIFFFLFGDLLKSIVAIITACIIAVAVSVFLFICALRGLNGK